MNVLVVGLNHKTADIEVRERLAFNGPKLEEGLARLRALPGVAEAVVLSTCNRVEMYLNVKDPEAAAPEIKGFLSEFHGIRRELLDPALYFLTGREALRHSFSVPAGLDSMVMGEPQILGQFKEAFDASLKAKSTGVLLNKLMKKSISVAKRVRTETGIGKYAVSISFAAVELAKKIFDDLHEKRVLLLGAGEMAELAAKHLANTGVKEIVVANRTFAAGEELACEFKGRAVNFADFPAEMAHTDIVICSTGAPTYVITKPQVHHVMKERRQRHMFIIDISVPRNVDPSIKDMSNVYLYDVDDLQGVVDTNVQGRQKERERADAIVTDEIESFERWQSSLDAVPTIKALRERAEGIKQDELAKLMGRLKTLDDEQKRAVEMMASAIVNKLVHPPTAALKEDAEDKDVLIETIKRLYGL